jgi:hypothetical protein
MDEVLDKHRFFSPLLFFLIFLQAVGVATLIGGARVLEAGYNLGWVFILAGFVISVPVGFLLLMHIDHALNHYHSE